MIHLPFLPHKEAPLCDRASCHRRGGFSFNNNRTYPHPRCFNERARTLLKVKELTLEHMQKSAQRAWKLLGSLGLYSGCVLESAEATENKDVGISVLAKECAVC